MNEDKKEDIKEIIKENDVKKKPSFTIPLRFIKDDDEDIRDEMQELFNEDKVVHQQGQSEPEAD